MKIKKSQLIELIKEEIMSEMRGLTIMDDPSDDAAVPASMQHGGPMDQVGKEIENMIVVENDESIAIVSNYLVTQGTAGDSREAAIRGMEMLEQAGFRNADPAAIKQIISGEMMDENEPMMEGVENITPENVQLVLAGLQELLTSPYTGPIIAAAFAAVGVEGIRDILSKQGSDNDG
jgi:hypothetical protein